MLLDKLYFGKVGNWIHPAKIEVFLFALSVNNLECQWRNIFFFFFSNSTLASLLWNSVVYSKQISDCDSKGRVCKMAEMYSIESYYALVSGDRGPNEEELLDELVSDPNFHLMGHGQPTVRMLDCFVLDKFGHLVFFHKGQPNKSLFLHGHIVSWDGTGPKKLIGDVPIREWSVQTIILCILIHCEISNHCLFELFS
jgi:hypothetical protein